MSIRGRALLGAIAFFGGLLLVTYGGVSKSSARIDFDRKIQRGQADASQPPSTAGAHTLMVLGSVAAVAGVVVIGFAARDMVAQIGSASSAAEARLQRELAAPKAPPPQKPPT